MSQRITIDPITRIEGHLRVDIEVDHGQVTRAWSSGQMWRGIEVILKGRDPREAWLFTQRICGVCTTVHAIASVRAVEDALKLDVPLNAQLIRNVIVAAHALHDHIVHFYHLSALDWVDVVSALKGDPAKASRLGESLSAWPHNSVREMTAVKERLSGFVAGGRLGIFENGYWGHSAMKLPPEVNLLAVAHYLQALDVQRKANQVVATLGGKTPNIQNLAVGGVANAINMDMASTLNMEKLYAIKDLLVEVKAFVEQVYFVDVCAIGAMYPEWLTIGRGVTDYLAVPDLPTDAAMTRFDLPGGTVRDGDLARVHAITDHKDPYFRDHVEESIARAYYDGDWQKHPYDEETVPRPGAWEPDKKYSWVKAPRFEDRVTQVGPLAQVLVGLAQKHEPTVRWATLCLDTVSAVARTRVGAGALHSTLGRHASRAIRAAMMGELALKHWGLLVDNIGRGDTTTFNEPHFPEGEVRGVGLHEAPRGVLSHWLVIRDGKIANYQAVVPSTWNAGPRDSQDRAGPYEASLVGTPIADPERPLEALRTIHSFDPCLACAVHTHDPSGREISRVQVL